MLRRECDKLYVYEAGVSARVGKLVRQIERIDFASLCKPGALALMDYSLQSSLLLDRVSFTFAL
jgi:hypothetical protein